MMRQHKSKSSIEEPLARMFMQQPNNLSWLAILLTGDRTLSIDAEVEALGRKDMAKSFFENWMAAWSRKLFIAKALAAVNSSISASVSRTEARHSEYLREMQTLPLLDWGLDTDTDKLELERALLAIDVFPRCALLLMVFEKLSLDDVAILLNVDKQLVATAKSVGPTELSRSMERTRPGVRTPASLHVDQHNGITDHLERTGYGKNTSNPNREIWRLVVHP
jgi:hypothetical protein